MKKQPHKKPQQQQLKKGLGKFNNYIRYISLSTEMIGAMLLCAWLGRMLDQWQETDKPYFTIGFLLFGVFSSLMLLIKGLKKISDDNKRRKDPDEK
ncbi:AtpZ/AtpI family protein [Limibacter armeniacum]|uniref:AtpZ/AtpI family protein n=1 Tax=Limibacter armeniacum TaxID=466084 RepID=UPI002FE616F2